jgi:hypothetical protein
VTGNLVVGSDGAGNLTVNGSFTAESKSFDIPHPSKEGFRLRYGVLEGPEHGVYVRGVVKGEVIELPDYWTDLIHEDSITVQLTPIGKFNDVSIVEVNSKQIKLQSESGTINHFFFVQAERKDVERFQIEYRN